MYFLKTQGSNTVIEYLQIRDEQFALVEYFKLSLWPRFAQQIKQKYGLRSTVDSLKEQVERAPYNMLCKFE